MKRTCTRDSRRGSKSKISSGFTLVELLVAMVVASVAMGAIGSIFISTSKSYAHQRELARMQQNLRAAMYLIKNDLRNSGRNGLMNGTVGITNVGRFNADADDASGYPGITMTSLFDADNDGQGDPGSIRTIAYQVFDADGDGIRELRRQDSRSPNPAAWDLVFDGIEDIGFAYAFDADNDLDLDRNAAGAGSTVMWGIDTDATAGLDTNTDNNADGDIDALDDGDDDGWIDAVDGGLGTQVALNDIRAVRIWMLARAEATDTTYTDTNTYVLGHKVIDMTKPANANRARFRHRMLVGAVALPNHEWKP
jgi:type IV pilus assembly protein PilW